MGISKNPRWPPSSIKFDNICKTINIFDRHKEQKLFLIKKYTFPEKFINIEQIIKKVMSLRKMQKVKKCAFSRFSYFLRDITLLLIV